MLWGSCLRTCRERMDNTVRYEGLITIGKNGAKFAAVKRYNVLSLIIF